MSATLRKICKECGKDFIPNHANRKVCTSCLEPKPCLCGCGKYPKGRLRKYCLGCRSRGKSYLERFGGRKVNCGAKPGELNTAKRPEIRKKISEAVKRSYTPKLRESRRQLRYRVLLEKGLAWHARRAKRNSKGEAFRSCLEVLFSELLIKNNIPYQYEARVPLYDGSVKVIDFLVEGSVIEISGFAYKNWQEDFLRKMKKLRESISNQILVLTYPDKLDEIYKVCSYDTYIASIYDEARILKDLKFMKQADYLFTQAEFLDHGFRLPSQPSNL